MNTEVTNETNHASISISALLGALKKFLILIIIATVVVGALAGVCVKLFTKTSYSANAKFQVVNVLPSNAYISDAMLSAAADIAGNCVEIIREPEVIKAAVNHKLPNGETLVEFLGAASEEQAVSIVAGMVAAGKASDDSAIFTVSVNTSDMNVTYQVINAIQDVLPTVVKEIYNVSENNQIMTQLRPLDKVESINEVYSVRASSVKYALIGAAVAFVLSYIVCFFIYINDTKVYDDSTIKAHFSAPVIGIIPEWNIPGQETSSRRSKKRSVVAGDKRDYTGKLLSSQTPFAVMEAFNTLRTNLCYSTAAEKCPVFAVTSDFSGAGKSVISANIATSLAMLGKKTLLVECDLRRPELAEVFEADKKVMGLSELLSGVVENKEAVISSVNQDGLSVVFSGRIPPNPSELLGSEKMAQFIKECRDEYDVIIVDTPPAFEVSDVGVIVPLITGTVMVARSNYSDVNAIEASEELINGVNGRIVGYVVNDVDFKSGGSYYYRKKRYGYRGYRKYARYYSTYESKKENTEE